MLETVPSFGAEYPVDLPIIDLGLPEIPGLEVLRRLRAGGHEFPILVLTARAGRREPPP